jgi:hypothetical protein
MKMLERFSNEPEASGYMIRVRYLFGQKRIFPYLRAPDVSEMNLKAFSSAYARFVEVSE